MAHFRQPVQRSVSVWTIHVPDNANEREVSLASKALEQKSLGVWTVYDPDSSDKVETEYMAKKVTHEQEIVAIDESNKSEAPKTTSTLAPIRAPHPPETSEPWMEEHKTTEPKPRHRLTGPALVPHQEVVEQVPRKMERTSIIKTVKNTPEQHEPFTRVQPVHRTVLETDYNLVNKQIPRLVQDRRTGHNTNKKFVKTRNTKTAVKKSKGKRNTCFSTDGRLRIR